MENAAATDRDFCLATDENGALELRHDHPYYYQVRAVCLSNIIFIINFFCSVGSMSIILYWKNVL